MSQKIIDFPSEDVRYKSNIPINHSRNPTNLQDIYDGLDTVLSLFSHQDFLFPRTIMTTKTNQVIVYSPNEALQKFTECGFMDCRINGYPFYKNSKQIVPTFIFIDIDETSFGYSVNSNTTIDKVLNETLSRIRSKIDGHPMVLKTGGGYHIYQPIHISLIDNPSIPLERLSSFDQFLPYIYSDPTTDFIRFLEKYLSNNQHDKNHTPSPNSCLIRIPNTVNSKYGNKIKVIQPWDGKVANANGLVLNFLNHLIQRKLDGFTKQSYEPINRPFNSKFYNWIEKLLQTPIEDYRKFCLWRILIPYLVNVRSFTYEETFNKLIEWLQKCDKLNKITFNQNMVINNYLRYVKSYLPISIRKLKLERPEIYDILRRNNIIN